MNSAVAMKKRIAISEEEHIIAKKRKKALALQDLTKDIENDRNTKVPLPLPLKQHMVDEWGLITEVRNDLFLYHVLLQSI